MTEQTAPTAPTAPTATVFNVAFEMSADIIATAIAKWKAALAGAETTVANADTLFGRSALVALIGGTVTPANMAIAAYAAFNPKGAKGKKATPKLQGDMVLSVSSLRTAKGGDSARKALDALFAVHATMNGQTDADGANVMVPSVLAFINGDKGACTSIRKLHDVLQAAQREDAKRLGLVNDNDSEGEGEGEGDGNVNDVEGAAIPGRDTLTADAILSLAGLIETASDDALAASDIGDAMQMLFSVMNERYGISMEAPEAIAA